MEKIRTLGALGAVLLSGCVTHQVVDKPVLSHADFRSLAHRCHALPSFYGRPRGHLPNVIFVTPEVERIDATGVLPSVRCIGEGLGRFRYSSFSPMTPGEWARYKGSLPSQK